MIRDQGTRNKIKEQIQYLKSSHFNLSVRKFGKEGQFTTTNQQVERSKEKMYLPRHELESRNSNKTYVTPKDVKETMKKSSILFGNKRDHLSGY